METPSPQPPPKPPFWSQFVILLLLPIGLMALAFSAAHSGDQFTGPLLGLAGVATLICSIVLGRRLGRHFAKPGTSSAGMAFLMFFALMAFYGICFFVGCTATLVTA